MLVRTGLFACLVGLGLVACGGSGGDSNPSSTSSTPPGSTGDGGADQLPPGAPPPPVGTPTVDELTEKYGAFVATNGTADGDGTRAHPFSTIAAAIERVKDLKLRVYVCGGTYKEQLTLVSGVSVIGGLTCAGGTWLAGGPRVVLDAPASPAVRARDITLATRFEAFDVSVPDGTASAPSSIALIAERAPKLTIASSKITSRKGFDGADGNDGTQLTLGASATGKDGLPYVGAFFPAANQTIARRLGQAGGIGSCTGAAGHDGENGTTGGNGSTQICEQYAVVAGNKLYHWAIYSTVGGVKYDRSDAVAASGATGATGVDGESAKSIGELTGEGYAVRNGTAGTDGAPGKGGSGGNGGITITDQGCDPIYEAAIIYCVAGPGGGAGGCPGLAGTPGVGGGASIGALVLDSPGLALKTTEIISGAGGNAGKGAFGSEPTVGGAAGMLKNGAPAGASGGAGGRAGYSGNGSAGPSFGLKSAGGAPVVDNDCKLVAGAGGAGVAERQRTDAVGNLVTIPASPAGPAASISTN